MYLCRLHNHWKGGIMEYCEFIPLGNGRPANNPTALAKYLKNEQTCLQVTQNMLFCRSGLRFLIIAHFRHRVLERPNQNWSIALIYCHVPCAGYDEN